MEEEGIFEQLFRLLQQLRVRLRDAIQRGRQPDVLQQAGQHRPALGKARLRAKQAAE